MIQQIPIPAINPQVKVINVPRWIKAELKRQKEKADYTLFDRGSDRAKRKCIALESYL